MITNQFLFILLLLPISLVYTSHFRGGTVVWRPLNNTPSGTTVQLQVKQRYSWRRGMVWCNDTTIAAGTTIGAGSTLGCASGPCPSWTSPSVAIYCTDFSALFDLSSGEVYNTITIPLNVSYSVSFSSNAWLNELVIGAGSSWDVVNRINTKIRPDGFLNSSPMATTLPVIYKATYVQHVHVVQMADFDGTDTLQCRWSNSNSTGNFNGCNECGGVCSGIPGAVLYGNNCTLVFTLYNATWYYAVALQIEDYYSSTSTTPMSSVPLQFLFYAYTVPGGCSTPPSIIGVRPNRACIGTPIGANVTEYVIAQVGCTGKTIIDFTSSSPIGMKKSIIQNPSTGIYQIILSWIPVPSQYGPQGFCAGAVDNTNVQSDQWCITYVVGFDSPSIIRPTLVQGSVSPLGTIFQNQTVFSFQTSKYVGRPTRNGTYIYFNDATTNTTVQSFDCGWAPEVTYTGYTAVIRFPTAPWIPGHSYYVTFDSGVASGTEFCGPESAAITDPSFWVFNIWDPGLSSTTTTTTTPPTTGTITTRAVSTTTVNTMLTTTGIIITSTSTLTTTTATTTSSSTTSTSSATTATTTAATSTVAVMYPSDFEKACRQPVAVMSVINTVIMGPIKAIAMFMLYSHLMKKFNPSQIETRLRHQRRVKSRY